jgi:hypothetical protein
MTVYIVTDHYKGMAEIKGVFYSQETATAYAATISNGRVSTHTVRTDAIGCPGPTNWWD